MALAAAYSNSIIAWNFPLAGYQEGWSKRRLDAPPEPSAFFNEGDVLYDIPQQDAADKTSPDSKPDWLIWNETSGMMVGKGSWQALYLLADKLRTDGLPMSPKVTFAVFEFPAGEQVAADAVPTCSFSVVSHSGNQFTLKQTSGPWKIELEGEVYRGEFKLQDDIRIDSALSLTLSKGDERLEIRTNVSSQAGGSIRLARGVHHGHGIEVRASFQLLLPDGRVRMDDIFEEKDGKPQRLDRALVDAIKTPAGWFRSVRMSPATLKDLAPDKNEDEEVDPFAEKPSVDAPSKLPFPLIEFPAHADKWAWHPLWDMSEILKLQGVSLEAGDKVGYDPLRDQLCMLSENKGQIDLLDILFIGCIRYSRNIEVSVNDLTEELSVTTKNFQKGFISHTNGEISHSIEAEAKYGEERGGLVEVALEMHGSPHDLFKTTNIVWDGQKIPLGMMNANGGTPVSWTLKAEVIPLEIHP